MSSSALNNRFSHAADVIAFVQPKHKVFVHGGSATPTILLEALTLQASRLKEVELMHLHTEGTGHYADPEFGFRVLNLFVGRNMRDKIDSHRVDYLPCFLSEIPALFRSKRRPVDVALLHVSTPDRHGYCSLGTSVDVARAAFDTASIVLAQVNKQMPHVHGDGFIHINEIDAYVEVDVPLPEPKRSELSEEEKQIGKVAAGIIDDGACLQVGIGSVPDAVLAALNQHRHLGVHSEMWSDGILKLVQSGAIDNSRKVVHPGKLVSTFLIGSRSLYDFVDDNPSVIQLPSDYVNNPNTIARNPRATAINSAIEIDLTGQVCADSIGHKIISGVGGQMDFTRGAALSKNGKPIIAITSCTKRGNSKIVPTLRPGAGVVTTRAHVHFIITEYGAVDLSGKTLEERAKALIGIAHPTHRETLSREWHEIRSKI